VIELGPGKGILTKPLSERGARLVGIEVDKELFGDLDAYFRSPEAGEGAANVELINEDFTRLSLTTLLASRGLDKCVLFGNIPYYLTRDVLFSFLVDEYEMIDAAYIMVQREVGERIVAAAREHGCTVMVGYNKRSDPAVVYARQHIQRLKQSGELGRLTYVRMLMPAGDWIASKFALVNPRGGIRLSW